MTILEKLPKKFTLSDLKSDSKINNNPHLYSIEEYDELGGYDELQGKTFYEYYYSDSDLNKFSFRFFPNVTLDGKRRSVVCGMHIQDSIGTRDYDQMYSWEVLNKILFNLRSNNFDSEEIDEDYIQAFLE